MYLLKARIGHGLCDTRVHERDEYTPQRGVGVIKNAPLRTHQFYGWGGGEHYTPLPSNSLSGRLEAHPPHPLTRGILTDSSPIQGCNVPTMRGRLRSSSTLPLTNLALRIWSVLSDYENRIS